MTTPLSALELLPLEILNLILSYIPPNSITLNLRLTSRTLNTRLIPLTAPAFARAVIVEPGSPAYTAIPSAPYFHAFVKHLCLDILQIETVPSLEPIMPILSTIETLTVRNNPYLASPDVMPVFEKIVPVIEATREVSVLEVMVHEVLSRTNTDVGSVMIRFHPCSRRVVGSEGVKRRCWAELDKIYFCAVNNEGACELLEHVLEAAEKVKSFWLVLNDNELRRAGKAVFWSEEKVGRYEMPVFESVEITYGPLSNRAILWLLSGSKGVLMEANLPDSKSLPISAGEVEWEEWVARECPRVAEEWERRRQEIMEMGF